MFVILLNTMCLDGETLEGNYFYEEFEMFNDKIYYLKNEF